MFLGQHLMLSFSNFILVHSRVKTSSAPEWHIVYSAVWLFNGEHHSYGNVSQEVTSQSIKSLKKQRSLSGSTFSWNVKLNDLENK